MARASIPFITAFHAAVRPTLKLEAISSNEVLKAELLQLFNRAYKIGYHLPAGGAMWEDARVWAEITPVDGVISFDVLGDSREFEVWTKDPRETRLAESVTFFTDRTGIHLGTALATVWVSWIPHTVKFNTAAWITAAAYAVGDTRTVEATGECYRCLIAHTSGTFATDLAASKWVLLPVLEVLEEFLICYVHATYEKESGNVGSGIKMQQEALTELRETYRAEIRRNRQDIKP